MKFKKFKGTRFQWCGNERGEFAEIYDTPKHKVACCDYHNRVMDELAQSLTKSFVNSTYPIEKPVLKGFFNCPNCKHKIPDVIITCSHCGAKLNSSNIIPK